MCEPFKEMAGGGIVSCRGDVFGGKILNLVGVGLANERVCSGSCV